MQPRKRPVVIEAGSYSIKCGLAGDPDPLAVVRNLVACPIENQPGSGLDCDANVIFGEQALQLANEGRYRLIEPVEFGFIGDYDALAAILRHVLIKQLHINSNEHPVAIMDPPLHMRQPLAKILFEDLRFPEVAMVNKAEALVLAQGWKTGVVVDVGYRATFVSPVYGGYLMAHAMLKSELAGKSVDCMLIRALETQRRRYTQEHAIALEKYKRERCDVALDPSLIGQPRPPFDMASDPLTHAESMNYAAAEVLFRPAVGGLEMLDSVDEMLSKSLRMCDREIQAELAQHVLVVGGGTMFPQFLMRFEKEFRSKSAEFQQTQFFFPPHRELAGWQAISGVVARYHDQIPWLGTVQFQENAADIHRYFLSDILSKQSF
jgi:actin-related protein